MADRSTTPAPATPAIIPSEEQVQASSRTPKQSGLSSGRRLSRAIFYDPGQRTAYIGKDKDVGQFQPLFSACKELSLTMTDLHDYIPLKFPARNSIVTIYVDRETESRPTLEIHDKDGRLNVMLTTMHLDRLQPHYQILRRVGLLSTCYVRDVPGGNADYYNKRVPATVAYSPEPDGRKLEPESEET